MVGGPEIALWALLLVASATDLLWGKIYNWLTFPFIVTGLLFQFYTGGWATFSQALLAVGAAFALFFPLFAIKAIAAGDAKLLMAIGAWSNPRMIVAIAAVAILVGACVGLVTLLRDKGLRGSAESVAQNAKQRTPTASALRMPFGPAFLCAYCIVWVAQTRQWGWV